MRLNTKTQIMVYLGRSPQNRGAWRRTRRRYAEALHYLPGSYRVWTTTQELDGLDRSRSLTLAEVLASQRGHVRGHGGGDYALASLARKLFTGTQGT